MDDQQNPHVLDDLSLEGIVDYIKGTEQILIVAWVYKVRVIKSVGGKYQVA